MAASTTKVSSKAVRVSFGKVKETLEVPNLLDLQRESFEWLIGDPAWRARVQAAVDSGKTEVPRQSGLEEIFEEFSPIDDVAGTMSL